MRNYNFYRMALLAAVLLCVPAIKGRFSDKIVERTGFEKGTTGYAENREGDSSEKRIKGYDLPVDGKEKAEAEEDSKRIMEPVKDIYRSIGKENAFADIFSDELIDEIFNVLQKTGNCITTNKLYYNMGNYEIFDKYLRKCMLGQTGSVTLYEIHAGGSIGRDKYIFDGCEMYLVSANIWLDEKDTPIVTDISCTRMKTWRYTDKGWFCYELCVPEYPEVSELVDGSRLIRVLPISEKNRAVSEKCARGIGYQGNNLFCSDWDISDMSHIDYNGLYEYLYDMKYGQRLDPNQYPNGIPRDEFETLMMEYLPIEPEDIRQYAVFDNENQTYAWARLGCFHYTPTFFGTSVPEVTDIVACEDGTVVLTIDAVCEMVLCDDAIMTHKLTVRFDEDGMFQYLGNKIISGKENIPVYQYRIDEKLEPSLLFPDMHVGQY